MLRIFIAINLPEEKKEELEAIAKDIKNSFPFEIGKWVEKENFHITLLFLGAIREENLPQVIEKTKKACQDIKPFKIKINKVLYGPPKTFPPRLIWFEGENNPIAGKIAQNLGATRFLPHITISRIKAWQWKRIEPEERPEIEREVDLEFQVNSIDIMESKLKRTGPEYSILESIKL